MPHNGHDSKRQKTDHDTLAAGSWNEGPIGTIQSVGSVSHKASEDEDVERQRGNSSQLIWEQAAMTRRPTIGFSDLPNELLLNILNNLTEKIERFCFSLVVPRVARLIPTLYEHVEIPPVYLSELLDTLLGECDPVLHIKHIKIKVDLTENGETQTWWNSPKSPRPLSDCDGGRNANPASWIKRVSSYLDFVQCGGLKSDKKLLTGLASGSADATLALIALAPNLETLWIDHFLVMNDPLELLSRVLASKAIEAPMDFQRLNSIWYDHYIHNPDEEHLPSALSSILQLPSLRTLELQNCIEVGDLDSWSCPEGSSPVTKIKLTDCFLTNQALVKFLQSFTGLVSFSCVRSTEFDTSPREPMPRDAVPGFSIYNTALTPHKHTLEDLEIVLDEEEHAWAWDYRGIGSLKHFSSLKRIQAAGAVLLYSESKYRPGHGALEPKEFIEILPASLHTFSLTSWSPNTSDKLMSFGNSLPSSKPEHLPNLRHVLDISASLDHEDDWSYDARLNWIETLQELDVSWERVDVPQVGHWAPDPYASFRDCMGEPCEGKMEYP